MSDDVASWHLGSDGVWTRHTRVGDGDGNGKELIELQGALIENNARRRRKTRRR